MLLHFSILLALTYNIGRETDFPEGGGGDRKSISTNDCNMMQKGNEKLT